LFVTLALALISGECVVSNRISNEMGSSLNVCRRMNKEKQNVPLAPDSEFLKPIPVAYTFRGQGSEAKYNLPPLKLYICTGSKPYGVMFYKDSEGVQGHKLADDDLKNLFGDSGVLQRYWGGPDYPLKEQSQEMWTRMLFVVDCFGNVVIAPIWQYEDGREVKHGDLAPGGTKSITDEPKKGQKIIIKDSNVHDHEEHAHYRGLARLGGEIIYNVQLGYFGINDVSGYSVSRGCETEIHKHLIKELETDSNAGSKCDHLKAIGIGALYHMLHLISPPVTVNKCSYDNCPMKIADASAEQFSDNCIAIVLRKPQIPRADVANDNHKKNFIHLISAE